MEKSSEQLLMTLNHEADISNEDNLATVVEVCSNDGNRFYEVWTNGKLFCMEYSLNAAREAAWILVSRH